MKTEDLNQPAVDAAINALRPGVERWSYNHGAGTFDIWEDSAGRAAPTWPQIKAQMDEDNLKWFYYEYARDRDVAYGYLKEQLDMIYNHIKAGTLTTSGNFVTFIDEVRTNHPAPSVALNDAKVDNGQIVAK